MIDTQYGYKNYIIQDSIRDGLWYVISLDNSNIIGSFSTSEDAEEYIDNKLNDTCSQESLFIESNNLPVKSYTKRKVIRTKYKDCGGIAYVLKSEYKDKYQCRNTSSRIYIGSFYDDNLIIYKSPEAARIGRNHSNSNYGIEEIIIHNGGIYK